MFLDVCLETVFTNLPVAERIRRIAEYGYTSVEGWFLDLSWEATDAARTRDALKEIAAVCRDAGVTFHNLVLNSPDGKLGGALTRPQDHAGYIERLKRLMELSSVLDCSKAITCAGNRQYKVSEEDQRRSVVDVLREAAELATAASFTLFLEPLNTVVDHAGYFLDSPEAAASIVREVNSPAVRLLYDVYHMQIMSGNHVSFLRDNLDIVGHFHSAGVPGRHELFDGEVNYPFILKSLDAMGYRGSFGLEYVPAMEDHAASLQAVRRYLER